MLQKKADEAKGFSCRPLDRLALSSGRREGERRGEEGDLSRPMLTFPSWCPRSEGGREPSKRHAAATTQGARTRKKNLSRESSSSAFFLSARRLEEERVTSHSKAHTASHRNFLLKTVRERIENIEMQIENQCLEGRLNMAVKGRSRHICCSRPALIERAFRLGARAVVLTEPVAGRALCPFACAYPAGSR